MDDRINELWGLIVADRAILRGDDVGPSGASWQDVAGTMACNMRVLAETLDQARRGEIRIQCFFSDED